MLPAISIRNLGKRYRVNHAVERAPYRTLRDSLARAATAPLRRLRGETRGRSEEFWALKDVEFDVQPGEVVGIIGRNGAGKSTLLKILSRITNPTTGEVTVNGRVGSLLEVGTGFHPELTGRENIYMNGSILGMSRREISHQFDEITAFAEIGEFLDTPVKRYSSGMYVRLAFAVAAHLKTEVLIVDEVLAVGDSEFQAKCLGKMRDIAAEERTVLFVSHNLHAIEQLCTRACLLRSGHLAADGATKAVLREYANDSCHAADGVFDLREHGVRHVKNAPIIQSLRLIRNSTEPTNTFYSREPFVAEITIDPPRAIKKPRLALAIEDCYGGRITTVASYFGKNTLDDVSGRSCFCCTIPTLCLGEGHYMLSVSIATETDGLLDSLDRVAWFEVRARNAYGAGEEHHPVYGPMLCDSAWEEVHLQ